MLVALVSVSESRFQWEVHRRFCPSLPIKPLWTSKKQLGWNKRELTSLCCEIEANIIPMKRKFFLFFLFFSVQNMNASPFHSCNQPRGSCEEPRSFDLIFLYFSVFFLVFFLFASYTWTFHSQVSDQLESHMRLFVGDESKLLFLPLTLRRLSFLSSAPVVSILLILRSRHYIKCRSSISPAVLPFAPRLQCVSVRVSDAWQLRCFHHVHRVKVQAWRDGRLSFHPVGEAADGDLLSLYHIFTSAPLRKCFCFFSPPVSVSSILATVHHPRAGGSGRD